MLFSVFGTRSALLPVAWALPGTLLALLTAGCHSTSHTSAASAPPASVVAATPVAVSQTPSQTVPSAPVVATGVPDVPLDTRASTVANDDNGDAAKDNARITQTVPSPDTDTSSSADAQTSSADQNDAPSSDDSASSNDASTADSSSSDSDSADDNSSNTDDNSSNNDSDYATAMENGDTPTDAQEQEEHDQEEQQANRVADETDQPLPYPDRTDTP